MKDKILTYSRARGLFAGVDLSGTVVKQDKDETRILFGKMATPEDILSGRTAAPASSEPLLSVLRKVSSEAKGRERASK